MHELTKYDEARNALAICASIDEVKDIQDKSEAMRLYAKMSENTELEIFSATIKLRAQVRLGEIIAGMNKAEPFHRSDGGTMTKTENIHAAGISKTTAHHYEKLASVPEETLEKFIAQSAAEQKPVSMPKALAFASPPRAAKVTNEVAKQEVPSPVSDTITIDREQYEEMAAMVEESLADAKALERIIDADDKLKQAVAEVRQLTERVRVMQTRIDGLMNEKNAAIKMVKSRDNQIAKLQKEIKAFQAERDIF